MHLNDMEATAPMSIDESSALLAAVHARDSASMTRLVAMFDQTLVKVAFVVTGDRAAAEDAAQATWERLWHRPPRLREPSKLRPWLLKVCLNEARQVSRRRRRGAELEARASSDRVAPVDLMAELADLQLAIARLAVQDRELLALRFVVELPSDEIARHLGLSPEGARTRLHRLLDRLRRELRHE